MKTSVFVDEEKLIEKAIDALFDKLGPVEAVRFLTLPKNRRMDSVKRHRLWQAQLNEEEFLERILRKKEATTFEKK